MKAALSLTDDDLHAYADGQLSPERAAQVGDALGREPSLAARVTDIRQQNAKLRDVFDPWLRETLPRELVDAAKPPRSWRDDLPDDAPAGGGGAALRPHRNPEHDAPHDRCAR
jgi:anti-sigma factor RsiW